MRLIEEAALGKKIELYEKAISKGVEWEEFKQTHQVLAKVRRLILQAPTVDAEVLKHGHWSLVLHGERRKYKNLLCSECNEHIRYNGIFYNYCPNCGAKMDGDTDGID